MQSALTAAGDAFCDTFGQVLAFLFQMRAQAPIDHEILA
jgi:hypothetical protein